MYLFDEQTNSKNHKFIASTIETNTIDIQNLQHGSNKIKRKKVKLKNKIRVNRIYLQISGRREKD